MIVMKELKIRKIKNLFISLLTTIMIFSVVAFIASKTSVARADSSPAETELFLPKTALEYKELTSPIDAYSDDTVTAIAQDYTTLILNVDGEFIQGLPTFDTLKQVGRLSDSKLIVLSRAILKTIDLENPNLVQDFQFNNSVISANSFSLNDRYLVSAFGGEIYIYEIENGTIVSMLPVSIKQANKDNTTIAINDNNDIFYINEEGKLLSTNVSSLGATKEYLDVIPSRILVKDNFVYYLTQTGEIFRIDVDTNSDNYKKNEQLFVQSTDSYDLGKLVTPSGISFKGENLLITDAGLNAVQEFKIVENSLIFTGFAIAKDKTAFNRLDSNVTEIEKFHNNVAVLDGDSLLFIKNNQSFNPYDTNCFNDYSDIKLEDKMPSSFALGENTALLVYESNLSSSKLHLFNISDGTFISQNAVNIFDGNIVRDVCYQSGKYYILTSDGNACKVYTSSENQLSFNEYISNANITTQITVDVFGNVYLLDQTNSKIYKYTANNLATHTEISCNYTVAKMSTDLGGTLFILSGNDVYYLNETQNSFVKIDIERTGIDQDNNVKSFAMDYVNQDVFFIYENEEFVCKTSGISNLAISSLEIPADYVTTSTTATFENLKVYKPTETENVYSVNKTESCFEYLSLVTEQAKRTEFALICEITCTSFGKEISLLALAGQDGVVLVNQKSTSDCQSVITTTAPQKAFITTAVHTYYLPISTKDDGYALLDNNKVRLLKYTEIEPQNKFTFLGKDYYFASVKTDGVTRSGYIPVDFTVEILAEDFEWENFTKEKVNKTTVYSDKEKTSAVLELERGTEIRLLKQDGSTCKIAYQIDQTSWAVGYIDASSIQDSANVAIRNILIILAVTACVCGTTSYFLLRRKK